MSREPITLYARLAEPARVARRLREIAADVRIDGPDEAWNRAVVTFTDDSQRRSLTLIHSPEHYAEPTWSNQMRGMAAYFWRFPASPRKERVAMLTTTFKFVLATQFEPEFDPSGDSRLDVLFAVAAAVDGVFFTPSSLRDRNGRILFGAGGENEEDPDAVWPQIAGEVTIDRPAQAGKDSEDERLDPPSPERVARRALALSAVTARAFLEQSAGDAKSADDVRDVLSWLHELNINDELEPNEWKVLQRPLGRLELQDQINATWRLEALVVLAWALQRFDLPPHDTLVEPNALWQSLGLLDDDAARLLLAEPSLRPRNELDLLRERVFALHWRLTNFHLNGKTLDFADFARTCWFGPLDISGLPLIECDLAIDGLRIDRADEEILDRTNSATRERHLAINWLWEGPELLSDARMDT